MSKARTEGLGNETIGSSLGGYRAASEELHDGGTRTVRDSDSTSESDEVTGRDVVAREDGLLDGDGLVETDVRVEGSLDVGEGVDGAVGATTAEYALGLEGGRDGDRVVEDTGVPLLAFL